MKSLKGRELTFGYSLRPFRVIALRESTRSCESDWSEIDKERERELYTWLKGPGGSPFCLSLWLRTVHFSVLIVWMDDVICQSSPWGDPWFLTGLTYYCFGQKDSWLETERDGGGFWSVGYSFRVITRGKICTTLLVCSVLMYWLSSSLSVSRRLGPKLQSEWVEV